MEELDRWREAGKAVGIKLGVVQERERIINLVYKFEPELFTKGASDRDIEAFNYAIWQFRYKLVDAIKGENK